jgi:hypothetical protein
LFFHLLFEQEEPFPIDCLLVLIRKFVQIIEMPQKRWMIRNLVL